MSARTRTLLQLRTAVADRGDISIATSGVRHTTSLVNDRLNRAIQRWLLMIADAGDQTNLKTTRTATATSTTRDAANWAPYQYVAQPSGLLYLVGMDIWSNNTPIAMMKGDEMERNDAQLSNLWWSNGATGMPVFYRLGGINASGTSLIQISPWADAVYTVDVRYIPAHTDLSQDGDTIDFIAGGEEWVVNDAVMQSKITDGISGTADLSAIISWNREIEKDLRFTLACRGVHRKQDTVDRREMLKRMSVGGWRIPG